MNYAQTYWQYGNNMALPRQKHNWDQVAALVFMENINMMVPYYLMASYAYYKQDDPIFSDGFFDNMVKTMLERWDDIEHWHKEYINKGDLEAGTVLGEYPTRVEGALRSLRSK